MNRYSTKKAILIFMHNLEDNVLKAISQNFSDQLQAAVQESDGPKIIDSVRRIGLRDQCDITSIDALQVQATPMKLLT